MLAISNKLVCKSETSWKDWKGTKRLNFEICKRISWLSFLLLRGRDDIPLSWRVNLNPKLRYGGNPRPRGRTSPSVDDGGSRGGSETRRAGTTDGGCTHLPLEPPAYLQHGLWTGVVADSHCGDGAFPNVPTSMTTLSERGVSCESNIRLMWDQRLNESLTDFLHLPERLPRFAD